MDRQIKYLISSYEFQNWLLRNNCETLEEAQSMELIYRKMIRDLEWLLEDFQ